MLIKTFDFGWGAEWLIKQIETSLVQNYLRHWLANQNTQVVIINSTWYGTREHDLVMSWLRTHAWSHAVLVSMIDAAIVKREWFSEFDRDIIEVGYYPGANEIIFWADIAKKYILPVDLPANIDTAFMCLNRKPHWHRRRLFRSLQAADLVKHGIVSMGCDDQHVELCLINENLPGNSLAPNGYADSHGIPNDIASLGDPQNWQRHFLNVVTETVYDINSNHFVSEKIFKPMIGGRPFLVYDADGGHKWLTDHGFMSYVTDFRDISDLDLKEPNNLVPFLGTLVQQPVSYFKKKLLDLGPKIKYNEERFTEFVIQQQQKILQGLPCPI